MKTTKPRSAKSKNKDLTSPPGDFLADLLAQDEFLIVGGAGFAIVVAALLLDSPYAWVIFFGYLLVVLPALVIYLKRKNRPLPEDQTWRSTPIETDAHRALRERLAKAAAVKSLLHEEYARAVLHYDQGVQSYEAVRQKLLTGDVVAREKLAALFSGLSDRLQKIAVHLQALSALDTGLIMKKIQGLQSKSRLGEPDRAELVSLHEKIAFREQTLSLVVDALRENEQALREMISLGSSRKSDRRPDGNGPDEKKRGA